MDAFFGSITLLKTHCVTNLRASTQRCACCVLELLRFFGFLVLGSPKTKKTKPKKKHTHLSLVLSPWGLLLVYFFLFFWFWGLQKPKNQKTKKNKKNTVICLLSFHLGISYWSFFFFVVVLGSPVGIFVLFFLFFGFL